MSRPRGSNSGALWLTLALVVLASLAIRVRLLDVPLERDEGGGSPPPSTPLPP